MATKFKNCEELRDEIESLMESFKGAPGNPINRKEALAILLLMLKLLIILRDQVEATLDYS